MSKIIAQLLGRSETELSKIISKLEDLSGYNSEDVRFLADTHLDVRRKLIELGLDPNDSNGKEIYHALRARFEEDNGIFTKELGFKEEKSDKFNESLVKLFESTEFSKQVFCLKQNAAKDLLRKNHPKKVMKQLGYRSLESMLKRENIAEVFAAAPYYESSAWLNKFWKNHEKLSATDFETRDMELVVMSSKRWNGEANSGAFVTCMPQIGAAALWPISRSVRSCGPSLVLFLYEAAEILKIYGAALKLEQMKPSFGKSVVGLMRPQLHSPLSIEGQPISWQALHKYYGKSGNMLPAWDNLERTDLHHHVGPKLLSALSPAFDWWSGTNHLATLDNEKPLSMNLNDALINNSNNISYGSSITNNFKKHFYSGLLARYFKHEGVENYLLAQLDNPEFEPDTIDIRSKKYAAVTPGLGG
jgi:hypothetical protein